jgi:putative addiction module killer protein
VYFTRRGNEVVVLLVGGQKKRQSADIKRAIEMSRAL